MDELKVHRRKWVKPQMKVIRLATTKVQNPAVCVDSEAAVGTGSLNQRILNGPSACQAGPMLSAIVQAAP